VPSRYMGGDASLRRWVNNQRAGHANDVLLLDRKDLLDQLGFVWRVNESQLVQVADESYHSQWEKQFERLVEFKRKNGHCMVPASYKEDKSLGTWVCNQRTRHKKSEMRPYRKKLLDDLEFVWSTRTRSKPIKTTFSEDSADTLRARSSTTNVRGLVIGSFDALTGRLSHSRSFSAYLCRIRIRKRSPAVWVY
jgi:hypothetical protein